MTDGIVEIIKTILGQAIEEESNSYSVDDVLYGYIAAFEDLVIFLENGNRNNMHKPEYYCDLQSWMLRAVRLDGKKCWHCEKDIDNNNAEIIVSNQQWKIYFCSQECSYESIRNTDFSDAVAYTG